MGLTPEVGQYDIIHLMNVTRVKFTYVQMVNAKRQGKKVVLSPIYWNTRAAMMSYVQTPLLYLNDSFFLRQLGKASISSLRHLTFLNDIGELLLNKKLVSRVLSEVDCLLPNSSAELQALKEDYAAVFKKKKKHFAIVPNGVDAGIFGGASPKEFERKYGLRDFILNVGRFSYRKNQFNLIKALKGLDLKVVFIGGSYDSSDYYGMKDAIDKAYYQKCRREADSSFEFLPSMTQEELASGYSACKVFVLPSYYETPGLSALEAALVGANLCVTCGGSTYEYFSDLAFYVDPFDLDSIRRGVLKAFQANKGEELKRHVLSNFTWEKTAQATLRAYKEILDNQQQDRISGRS